jgi:uncharacterized protein YndB with AHSA1/START domain
MSAIADLAPGELIIVISREFNAPRALVFEAFTDPKHLTQFWGPKGFTCPVCEVDLRVGGKFRVEMRAPDGVVYPCVGIYREIVRPERIVYVSTADQGHPCGGGLPPRAIVTMTFADLGGRTRLTIHTRLQSAADRDAAIAGGFNEGWNDALDKLTASLARRQGVLQ